MIEAQDTTYHPAGLNACCIRLIRAVSTPAHGVIVSDGHELRCACGLSVTLDGCVWSLDRMQVPA